MSYADAAKHAPHTPDPQPDPNLLEHPVSNPSIEGGHHVDSQKINIVPAEEFEHPRTEFQRGVERAEKRAKELRAQAQREMKEESDKAKKEGREVSAAIKRKAADLEEEATALTKKAKKDLEKLDREAHKEYRKDPALYNTLISIVNVALLAGVGYSAYANWNTRWDKRVVSATAIGLGAFFSLQGFFGFEEYNMRKR